MLPGVGPRDKNSSNTIAASSSSAVVGWDQSQECQTVNHCFHSNHTGDSQGQPTSFTGSGCNHSHSVSKNEKKGRRKNTMATCIHMHTHSGSF